MISLEQLIERMPRDAFIVAPCLPDPVEHILRALCRALPALGRPTLFCSDITGRFDFLREIPAEAKGRLTVISGGGPLPRNSRAATDFCPYSAFESTQHMAQGRWPIDVCLASGRALAHGGYALSPQVGWLRSAAAHARLVALVADESLPRLRGEVELPRSAVHCVVGAAPGGEAPPPEPLEAMHRSIGTQVAELIPDGACIQIGIGSLADAVLGALEQHRDLSVHSGFLGDGLARLVRSGAVTGRHHPHHPGRIVCGVLLGSAELWAFANEEERLELHSFLTVNDPDRIRQIPRFHAINSALSVDLFGQVMAEALPGRLLAAGGGQMDFVPAAHRSDAGAAIVTLQSTATQGRVSRIVAPAAGAGIVTVHRNLVDYVVTEHGVADLRGANLRTRAARLIAIAAPAFQAALGESLEQLLG